MIQFSLLAALFKYVRILFQSAEYSDTEKPYFIKYFEIIDILPTNGYNDSIIEPGV